MSEQVKVSVICNAFNHEPYIGECLKSLICQITDFSYEILVHDDASTDKTSQIIKQFEKQYPEIIKPIYQKENQYIKGVNKNYQYPRVNGEYIAICEGDDYWTDEYKLQKQVDKLDLNPGIDICAHAASVIDAVSGNTIGQICPREQETVISLEDVILGEGGLVATNSLMYRAKINKSIPEFRKKLELDYTIQIHGSLRGGMLFLPDNMAVYRYNVPGSWTQRQRQQGDIPFIKRKQEALTQLDIDTEYKYHEVIKARYEMNEMIINNYKGVLRGRYKNAFNYMDIKGKTRAIILSMFPILKQIKAKIQESRTC